jgi:hypothetical protein
MDGIGIATFALRLAAIYVWIQALGQVFLVSTLLSIGQHGGPLVDGWAFAATFLPEVTLGAILWLASRALAPRVLGTEERLPLRGAAEIGSLALRLAGIWLLDETLQRAPRVLFLVQAGGTASKVPAEAAALGVLALATLVLLVGGGWIAKRFFPSAERAGSVAASLQTVAFGVLGLAILASALPALATELVRSGWFTEDGSTFGLMSASSAWTHDTASLLRVILGLALFLGSGPLTRFWRWAHTAGLERGPAT